VTEAHGRFGAWLTAGADGDPPRDLAVHASVCAGCRQSMAALDLLTTVDLGLAESPRLTPPRPRSALVQAGRLASMAAGVVIGAAILGVGAAQLIAAFRGGPGAPIAVASSTPDQGVLAGTQTPQATSTPLPTESPPSSVDTLPPVPTPRPTARLTPRPTSIPTPIPTAVPTASPIPTDTPTPTATETPVPTASPIATPSPTLPGAPTILSATPGAGVVDLIWSAPLSDGGSAVTGYEIWRGIATCNESLIASIGNQLAYTDPLAPANTYLYCVAATNSIGTGPLSIPFPATTT